MTAGSLALPKLRIRRPPPEKVLWWLRQVNCLIWLAVNVVEFARYQGGVALALGVFWSVLFVVIRRTGPLPSRSNVQFHFRVIVCCIVLGVSFLVIALI